MSARSTDVTVRKPALSSASFTVLRSDAHTSGAPEQRNSTAAFSGIIGVGAAAGCAAGSRAAGDPAGAPAGAAAGDDAVAVRVAFAAADVAPFTAAEGALDGGIFDASAS